MAPSPSATSRHRFPPMSPSQIFLVFAAMHVIFNFELQTVLFILFSANFTNVLKIRLSVVVFLKIVCNFSGPNYVSLHSLL